VNIWSYVPVSVSIEAHTACMISDRDGVWYFGWTFPMAEKNILSFAIA
jgi:hypothetical protein